MSPEFIGKSEVNQGGLYPAYDHRIMHNFAEKLLKDQHGGSFECLCKLMSIVFKPWSCKSSNKYVL